jgi:hypothetical protein
MTNPLTYQIIDKKPLNAENAPKLCILKNPPNMNVRLSNKT